VALKLVVTKLVWVKLMVINFWRSAPPEKTDCKKRPVYAMGGYIPDR